VIVSFTWPSTHHRTGGVIALYQFANALDRRGHEVHFVHGPAWPHRIDRISDLEWFRFEPGVQHHVVDSLDDPALPAADVIFSSEVPERLGAPAIFIQGFQMLPAEIERDAFRMRRPKVCVARWLVDVGLRFGVPPEQLWHVPLGIDHETFIPRTPSEDRRHDVAIVHNAHPSKGWALGWRALELARRRRPDLTAAVFTTTVISEPLPSWVEVVTGPLDQEAMATQVFDAARVFVQSSHVEGFGLTAVEAMASGCALVTTDNGGSRDYAICGETALVTPVRDADAMATAITELLEDDRRRAAVAATGAHHARRFEWDRGAAVLEGHLERYVADPVRYQAEPADDPQEASTA
jgi:glycosyltransferase involved in cell wall biosynthesis